MTTVSAVFVRAAVRGLELAARCGRVALAVLAVGVRVSSDRLLLIGAGFARVCTLAFDVAGSPVGGVSTLDAVEDIVPNAVPNARATEVRTVCSCWAGAVFFELLDFVPVCFELSTVGSPVT